MERDNEQRDDAIDLGAASVETLGTQGFVVEPGSIGKLHGITDE